MPEFNMDERMLEMLEMLRRIIIIIIMIMIKWFAVDDKHSCVLGGYEASVAAASVAVAVAAAVNAVRYLLLNSLYVRVANMTQNGMCDTCMHHNLYILSNLLCFDSIRLLARPHRHCHRAAFTNTGAIDNMHMEHE